MQKSKQGVTLQLAASNKSTEAAKLLLEHDTRIEGRNVYNRTHFHLAPWKNSAEAVKLLLESGAEIEASDKDNATPSQLAPSNNSTETVKLFLEKKMVEKKKQGMYTIDRRTAETAKLLLKRGSEIEARNLKNLTPLHIGAD